MKRFGSSRPKACPVQRGCCPCLACRRRSNTVARDAGIEGADVGNPPGLIVIAAH